MGLKPRCPKRRGHRRRISRRTHSVRSRTTERPLGFSFPAESPLAFLDGQIIDAGEAELHVTKFVELPILVAVSPIPLARVVVEFILETNRDAIAGEGPKRFLQTIVEFTVPFAAEEFDDLRAAMEKFGAVAPFGVLRVG